MKSRIFFPFALFFAIANIAGNPVLSSPASAIARRANGRILQVEGSVRLLRGKGRSIAPALGTQLYPGDRVEVDRGSSLWLQCDDLTVQSLPGSGSYENRCPLASQSDCPIPGTIECPDRGDNIPWYNPAIPYIISPRRTTLLSSQPPLFRWNPIPNATGYSVTLVGGNWETETSEPQALYSGDPLEPGRSYLLIVEASTGASSREEPPNGLNFQILDEQIAQTVREKRAKIEQQPLSESGKTLAIAQLYRQHHLIAKAIALLETLTESGAATAAIDRQLGDLYFENLALVAPAERYYARAIERVSPNDLEAQAAIQAGLGRSQMALGKTETARRWLTLARQGYETLGDCHKAKAVARLLGQAVGECPKSGI